MRLGTRGSALALAQARQVAALLGGAEVVTVDTRGDRGAGAGDKSRWVAELEQALLAGEIDLAVHSAKDVPGELPDGLALLGCPARAAPEDVLCGAPSLEELAPGGRVGTSSLRRVAQLRAARDDLEVVAIRGNVDTRLRKLAASTGAPDAASTSAPDAASSPRATDDSGERLDAIVLARAGLQRLGRERQAGATLAVERFVPAPGQGALALQGRSEDGLTRAAVERITDPPALASLLTERALARALGASCRTPLGAHAQAAEGGRLLLRAWVGLPDGSRWAFDELLGDSEETETLGSRVAERLRAVGADEILREAEELAG